MHALLMSSDQDSQQFAIAVAMQEAARLKAHEQLPSLPDVLLYHQARHALSK
jgi:hypothetical protein